MMGRAVRVAIVCAVAAASAATSWPAAAHHDEVDPMLDNPPGCTTATSEDEDGCGAQGRDHFANPDHRPPIEACATSAAPTGSVISRILPDGPRRADGSLAFVPGACVYLPPGYDSSHLQYPVLYLLHGGGGDQGNWVTSGRVRDIADAAYAADPRSAVIIVMPDGRSGQWHDWIEGTFLIERYVLDHLVPWVDAHFRTIADRRGRAIAGLSNGGYGALHFAAKRPDLFAAAGSMSGNIGARSFGHLGGETNGPAYYEGNVPAPLAENLDRVDLILDLGGQCTATDLTTDLCATDAFDLLFLPDHVYFQDRIAQIGHVGRFDYRFTQGGHAWRWWTTWLRERHLPFILDTLNDPEPDRVRAVTTTPAAFRYRSVASTFTVWGYDVTVERGVREFLDLRDVSATRMTVQGSGVATVVTAPRYLPGNAYRVFGARGDGSMETVRADHEGRLRVIVDLGPSHTYEQYSTQADVAERSGGSWTVRAIEISRDP